jgi:hypothetical protein
MTEHSAAAARWRSAMVRVANGALEQKQLAGIRNNRDIITPLTQLLTAINKEFFYRKLQDRVKDNLGFLHQIDSSMTSLVDEFGRSTHFYTNIGPYKILVYQPGTPTFLSSVKEGSDLVATYDSCQQNGPILGMSCACFLADFATHLSYTYQQNCARERLDAHDFHATVYETSLEMGLKMFIDEDQDARGRLLEMKNVLLNISSEHQVPAKQLEFYFYAKDIEAYRGRVGNAITPTTDKTDLCNLFNINVAQIAKHRRQSSTYKQTDDYFEILLGSERRKMDFIKSSSWRVIREKILNENAIFEDLNSARNQLSSDMDTVEKEIQQSYQCKLQSKKPIINETKPVSKKCCVLC